MRSLLLRPGGAIALTMLLMAVAWAENTVVRWTPFYVVYVALTVLIPLRLGGIRFGKLRTVTWRGWLAAVLVALGCQFGLSALVFGAFPVVAMRAGVPAENLAGPFWSLPAAQALLFERLAAHWQMEPAPLQFRYLLFLVVWAGVGEEIYFRGYLHKAFERWRLGAVAVVSAVLFGLRHATQLTFLGADYPWGAAAIWVAFGTAFGVALSILYARTRSLWPPVLAHYLFNIVPFLGMLGG